MRLPGKELMLDSRRPYTRAVYPSVLLGLVLCLVASGCNLGEDEETVPPGPTAIKVNSGFVADQSADCARADLISLQTGTIAGSLVAVDIVLTDCDGSLPASGLNFEISYDPSVLSFIGCSAGSFLPQNQLAPGSPACEDPTRIGNIVGTIGLTFPNFVTVGGSGRVTILQLTFNALKKGISSPIAFEFTDTNAGTQLWLIDTTPTPTFYALGGSGYAGGTFVSN
jgi:hypothetical protein